MIVSVLIRRLREGKDYSDFRAAWLPDKGFGVPTSIVSAIGLEDPREVVTIGFSDLDPADVEDFLARVGPQVLPPGRRRRPHRHAAARAAAAPARPG